MTDEERKALVRQLMKAFVLHGMGEHVQLLQAYAAAATRGEAGKGAFWNDAYALRWAAIFQLPPHHEVFSSKPARSKCDSCPDTGTHVSGKFPGGWVVKCDGCSIEWLVHGGDEPPV